LSAIAKLAPCKSPDASPVMMRIRGMVFKYGFGGGYASPALVST
jgi:hypothetical protein